MLPRAIKRYLNHLNKILVIRRLNNDDHISFNGRGAHYFTKDSSKKYLPEDLNVSKMHKLFKEKYPDVKVSYESYRTVFNNHFNISFGYPRTDTCSFFMSKT